MDDLITWLRTTIEGDLMRAMALPRGPWHVMRLGDKGYPQRITNGRALLIAELYEEGRGGQTPVADHIAVHDTDDTIARCEADLAILDEHAVTTTSAIGDDMRRVRVEVCQTCGNRSGVPCRTVRLLAQGYRRRPGWQEGWAP